MPADFLLWGFLKLRVCSNNPRRLEELKHNAEQAIAGADQQTLWKDAKDTGKRVIVYLQKRWGAFSASAVISACLSHSWYL
jgi:hypothetical protein